MKDAIVMSVFFIAMLSLAFALGMIWNNGTNAEKCLGVAILVIDAICFCINIFALC